MAKENIKKFRMGHQDAKHNGVLSVVTSIDYLPEGADGFYGISYGASFCSPTEPQYNKKFGYDLAEARLNTPGEIYTGVFLLKHKHLSHGAIKRHVLMSLLLDPNLPDWAYGRLYSYLFDTLLNW